MIITGGNGFLGSFLAEKAINKGFEVVALDDMSTSPERNVPPEVKLIRVKIEDYEDVEHCDYVAHLAARPSPEDYISNPIPTLTSNSLGTKRALDIAVKNNAVFLYTSSSEVYGEPSVIPTPETYYGYVNPNGVRSCYDEGKRFSEALIMAYHREIGLDTRIQRPFNVYGPRMGHRGPYGRVIPRFMAQSLRNLPLTVYGDGTQTRSFLYVDDWLEATWSQFTRDHLAGCIVNIGSSEQVSILDLATLIKKVTDSRSRITFGEGRVEDPTRRAADARMAGKLLDWKPRITLTEGLTRMAVWARGQLTREYQ